MLYTKYIKAVQRYTHTHSISLSHTHKDRGKKGYKYEDIGGNRGKKRLSFPPPSLKLLVLLFLFVAQSAS